MMCVAVPHPVLRKQLVAGQRLSRGDALPTAGDRLGVVKCAEGIYIDVEFPLPQPPAYVFDKARPQQQDVLPVVEVSRLWGKIDDCSEIHICRSVYRFKNSEF